MPRLHILTAVEHQAFDTPPVFSDAERATFFQVSESLNTILAALRSPTNRVYLVLTVGYFRAAKRFFAAPFPQTDVTYVATRLGYTPAQMALEADDAKASSSRHRQLTLAYLGFRPFNGQVRQEMAQEIRTMIRSHPRPKAIFGQVLTRLATHKTEIPSAYTLTELITHASRHHQRDLTATIEAHLSSTQRVLLDALLDTQETLWQPEPHVQRYTLTLLKRFSQSTRPARIEANIEDLRVLRPLYHEVKAVVDALDLTPEGVRYYANAVLKSRIFQVVRRTDDARHLHLVCFMTDQFLRLHDVLIDVLLLAVQSMLHACERAAKERHYTGRTEQRHALHTLVDDVRERLCHPLAAIERIAFSTQLTDTEKVCHIQDILSHDQAQRHTVASHLVEIHQEAQETNEDAEYYAVLESKSIKLQHRVADLVSTLHELHELGVGFISLSEALDFATPTGRAMAGMLAVFAKFERGMLREGVKAGIAEARRRGTRHGRPPTVAHQADEVRPLYAAGLSKSAIARRLGIGGTSVRRFLGSTAVLISSGRR